MFSSPEMMRACVFVATMATTAGQWIHLEEFKHGGMPGGNHGDENSHHLSLGTKRGRNNEWTPVIMTTVIVSFFLTVASLRLYGVYADRRHYRKRMWAKIQRDLCGECF